MKIWYHLLVLSALLLSSCSGMPGFNIAGTVSDPNLNGKYVYLYEYGQKEARDSALVENGAFTFKGVQDSAIVANLRFGQGVAEAKGKLYEGFDAYSPWFMLDNSPVKVQLGETPVVGGSPSNNSLNAYMQQLEAIYGGKPELQDMLSSKTDSLIMLAEERIEELDAQARQVHRDYIFANSNSPLAALALYANRYTLPEADQRELISALGNKAKQWPGIDKLAEHLAVLEKVAIGLKFTDFEMPYPQGKPHKLSEYVGNGKVVLIDFWASWCPPCRRSIPHLLEVYAQNKGKGFEIVGVSLDRTQEAWVKGITDLHITWPQMSDVQYWKSAAAALYGVNSIPHTVLVDKDGIIVAKNLHGKALENKIAELLP